MTFSLVTLFSVLSHAQFNQNNLIEVCQKLTTERLVDPEFQNWNVDYTSNIVSGIATIEPLFKGKSQRRAECIFNDRGIQLTKITNLKNGKVWDVKLYNNSVEW
ncbi:MAG: hypothetical protein ACXW30_00530 [Micavibrio sp.]